MRLFALYVLASSFSALVGCSAEGSAGIPETTPKTGGVGGDAPVVDPVGAPAPTAPACEGVAEAKQIAADATAADLRLEDGAIFFRSETKVIRAAKDGSGAAAVYESPALVRSLVGMGVIVTIEDPEPPNAIVKITSLEEDGAPGNVLLAGASLPTKWNAGGSYFVGADAEAIYAVGDEQEGEVIYELSRTLPALRPLATVTDGITSAQVASGGLWYVRDRSRVFQIPLGALDPNDPGVKRDGEPREIFGSTANTCDLAVGQDAAFCSAGAFLERRDLTGANPKTLLEASKSKVAAPFGRATWSDGTLYVRTSAPDAQMGHAIRAIAPSAGSVEERVVACGRSGIGEVAVDKDHVVWTEPGKGVFIAPR